MTTELECNTSSHWLRCKKGDFVPTTRVKWYNQHNSAFALWLPMFALQQCRQNRSKTPYFALKRLTIKLPLHIPSINTYIGIESYPLILPLIQANSRNTIRCNHFAGVNAIFPAWELTSSKRVPRPRTLLSRSVVMLFPKRERQRREQISRPTGASRNARSFVS